MTREVFMLLVTLTLALLTVGCVCYYKRNDLPSSVDQTFAEIIVAMLTFTGLAALVTIVMFCTALPSIGGRS